MFEILLLSVSMLLIGFGLGGRHGYKRGQEHANWLERSRADYWYEQYKSLSEKNSP